MAPPNENPASLSGPSPGNISTNRPCTRSRYATPFRLRRDDRPGMHRVHPDALPGVLHRGELRQQSDRALRRLVLRAAVVHADEAELRRDVDDRSTAGAPERRDGRLRAEEDALGVHVHHAIPVRLRRVLEPAGPADARVVDEHVQLSEATLGRRDGTLPVALAGDVEPDEDRLATLGADPRRHRRPLALEDVADDDARAFLSEKPRFHRSHSSRAATDQSYLAREPHRPLLVGSPSHARPIASAAHVRYRHAWTILPP